MDDGSINDVQAGTGIYWANTFIQHSFGFGKFTAVVPSEEYLSKP